MSERETRRPSAFVSYAQSGIDWQQRVIAFAVALRKVGGIDAELDIFHQASHRDWTSFGTNLIEESDFSLIAVDAAYKRRWQGTEAEGVGSGAAREAAAVKAIFERSQKEFVRRVKIVVLPGASARDIPGDLSIAERFEIYTFDLAGLEALLRSLWGKPAIEKPELGPIPALPPRAIAELGQPEDGGQDSGSAPEAIDAASVDERDRDKLLRRLEQLEKQTDATAGGAGRPRESQHEEFTKERALLEASLQALHESTETPSKGASPSKAEVSSSLQPFLTGLEDRDQSVRFEAMVALGERLEPGLLPTMEGLLEDRDPYIRQYALQYYAKLGGKDAVPRLLAALDDHDESVRFEAITALGDHLDPSMLPKMESLLSDSDPYIRQYALQYYAKLAGCDAAPRLLTALDDPDDSVRFEAMTALGDHLDPSMLVRMEALTKDRDSYIRQYALKYYAKLTER